MSKKILIIDDEADVMKMLVYRLKAKGYEVLTADCGKEGIERANTQKPDLILLDFKLLDMEATEVTGQIENKNIPVILITASVEGIAQKAEACSAFEYISKPIGPEELYDKVEKGLG